MQFAMFKIAAMKRPVHPLMACASGLGAEGYACGAAGIPVAVTMNARTSAS